MKTYGRGTSNEYPQHMFQGLETSGLILISPASVAQLDARPTGDQEVAGLPPSRSATFFHGD